MSKRQVNYAISDKNVTVCYDGQTHIVPRTDALADKLIDAVKRDCKDEIPNLVSAASRIERYGNGSFKVHNGRILINGSPVGAFLSQKILRFQSEGLPHLPLVRFAENLQMNPSYRAVNELFQFLEKNDHALTEDGCFIAYKRVKQDFTDIHSGTFDNSVGRVVTMPRNEVDENANVTCSHGLHVANWHYAHTQFASSNPSTDVMLEVKVNPRDVVSVPVDYNNSKMRTCQYEVLSVVDSEHSSDVQLRTMPEPEPEVEIDEDLNDWERCHYCEESYCYGECEDEEYPYDEELL